MKIATLLLMSLVLGCSVQPSGDSSPFAQTFVRRVPGNTTELYLVVNQRPNGGADVLDAFVADHAHDALQTARHHSETNMAVIFFFKDAPTSDHGSWGGFSISELQAIEKIKNEGKTYRSVQAWPAVRLPKQPDAEPGVRR